MATDRQQQVLRFPLMDGVPEAIGAEVANAGRIRELAAGDVLFSEGQPAASFSVVLIGSVKLVQLSNDGDAVVLDPEHAPVRARDEAAERDGRAFDLVEHVVAGPRRVDEIGLPARLRHRLEIAA